jgi:hypothetical protein
MTFETYQGLGRGGEFFQVNQCHVIAGCLLSLLRILFNLHRGKSLYSKASGAMAGFTVYKRHPGFL